MRIVKLIFLAVMFSTLASAEPVVITYQGKLQDESGAVSGNPGMEFRLYEQPEGGNPLSERVFSAVEVVEGVFQVDLEFSPTAFSELPRYLEVEVAGTVLEPRQAVRPAPFAVRALSADDAAFSAEAGILLSGRTFSLDEPYIASRFWRRGGSLGTDPSTDFIGTLDDEAFEIRTAGQRNFRVEPGREVDDTGTPFTANILGGSPANVVSDVVSGAFIGGGGSSEEPEFVNVVGGNYGVVVGGRGNRANDTGSTNPNFRNFGVVVGGSGNEARGSNSVVVGGSRNSALGQDGAVVGGTRITNDGQEAFIGGGFDNEVEFGGRASVIGGGQRNTIRGRLATIPGGLRNFASGDQSFAAGTQARALHTGAFVWADSEESSFSSTGDDQFLIKAAGGVGIGTNQPEETLHVAGDIQVDNDLKVDNNLTVDGVASTDVLRIERTDLASGGTDLCIGINGLVIECGSSGRYKTDVNTVLNGKLRVQQLNPVHFRWKNSGANDMGLIAEEVAEIEPRLVNRDDSGRVTGVRYRHLTALLISAVQEQSDAIEESQERIAALEAENAELRELAGRLARLEAVLLDEIELAEVTP